MTFAHVFIQKHCRIQLVEADYHGEHSSKDKCCYVCVSWSFEGEPAGKSFMKPLLVQCTHDRALCSGAQLR